MLTFTVAPKTVLGPCTHALWDGAAIYSRHHRHMPDGEAAWREQVERIFADKDAQAHAGRLVDVMRKQSAMMKSKPADSKPFKDLMSEEFVIRYAIEDVCPDDLLGAIIPPSSRRSDLPVSRKRIDRIMNATGVEEACAIAIESI